MSNDVKINIVAQDSTAPGLSSVDNNINKANAEAVKLGSTLDKIKAKLAESGQSGGGFTGFTSTIGEAQNALSGLGGGVSQVTSLVGGLGSAFGGVAAVLAGGAMFSESVQAFRNEASETKNLMNTLGMTAEAASHMRVELALASISGEDYTGMAMKFDRQLKSNEGSMNALGVATRDRNGDLLNQKQLLDNAVNTLRLYEAGTDRNEAAMRLFGRSAQEVFQLQKLNESTSARATELMLAYGLSLDEVSLKSAADYKKAMSEVKLAGEAVLSHIGEAVIPGLTSLAHEFTDIAVQVIPSVNTSLYLGGVAFSGFASIVKVAVDDSADLMKSLGNKAHDVFAVQMPQDTALWGTTTQAAAGIIAGASNAVVKGFDLLITSAKEVGNAIFTAFEVKNSFLNGVNGDLSGAQASMQRGVAAASAIFKEGQERLFKDHKDYRKQLGRIFS